MKKLIFATALAVGTLTAVHAQDKAIAQTSTDEAAMTQTVDAQETVAQDFKEIKATELPKPVLEAVATDFKGATVSKAYKNAKGEYKVVIATADKKEKTLYANADGKWMKKKMKMSKKKMSKNKN